MTSAEPGGVRAGPGDVGHRVVVRRRLAAGGLGDLLGELLRFDEVAVVVRDRHGTEHVVARQDVVAGKRIPPAPERRR